MPSDRDYVSAYLLRPLRSYEECRRERERRQAERLAALVGKIGEEPINLSFHRDRGRVAPVTAIFSRPGPEVRASEKDATRRRANK